MNQQINLFLPIFRKERKLLSFAVMTHAIALVLVALLLISAYGWRQTSSIETELSLLKKQLVVRKQQFSEMTVRLAKLKGDTKPKHELVRLRSELKARQQLVHTLQTVRETYTKGVSSYLEGFARQIPHGVWLTGILVQGGGTGLEIRGSSLKPDLVPEFLQRLSEEEALAGTQFGLLQIRRQDQDRPQVDFTLYTGQEPAGDKQ